MDPPVKRSNWKPPVDTGLWTITEKLYNSIRDALTDDQREFMDAEMGFFDQITEISGILKPVPPDERRAKIEEVLRTIKLERNDLYLPTNPDAVVAKIICDSGTPMPSKMKMPILVQFQVISNPDDSDEDQPPEPPVPRKQVILLFHPLHSNSGRRVSLKWVTM